MDRASRMTSSRTPSVVVHRANERFSTRTDWLDSAHSFSFGPHYDPHNGGFGLLLVNNDDRVAPGAGFDTHPHRDMEIVTWVLEGSLVHQDSEGHSGVIQPGLAQRMSAGSGIAHSEKNDSWTVSGEVHRRPVHFVQMWVMPDERGVVPGYEELDVSEELARGGLVTVASGRPRHADTRAISIHQRGAALYVARLQAGQTVAVPDADFVHLFVARGEVDLEGSGALTVGDAARLRAAQGQRVTAGSDAEILVWEMDSRLPGS